MDGVNMGFGERRWGALGGHDVSRNGEYAGMGSGL